MKQFMMVVLMVLVMVGSASAGKLKVELANSKLDKGYFTMNMVITNNYDKKLGYAELAITIYDKNGKLVGAHSRPLTAIESHNSIVKRYWFRNVENVSTYRTHLTKLRLVR